MKKLSLLPLIALLLPVALEAQDVSTPVKRPLMEEYTGLTCAFCPSGYVALEELKEEYGENFVAISYHNEDDMDLGSCPMKAASYPGCSIDRHSIFNPLLAKNSYRRYLDTSTPAEVSVTAEWALSGDPLIEATTTVQFAEDLADIDYRIAHILVADGLTNDKWVQFNNYSGGDEQAYPGEWWAIFTKAGFYVTGLVFNDVAVYTEDSLGAADVVPRNVSAGETVVYKTYIPTELVVNKRGKDIVGQNGSFANTRVVSVLIDGATGEVVNCNSSKHVGERRATAVGSVEAEPAECLYYSLDGTLVPNPGKGMYLKVEKFADGSARTAKIRL